MKRQRLAWSRQFQSSARCLPPAAEDAASDLSVRARVDGLEATEVVEADETIDIKVDSGSVLELISTAPMQVTWETGGATVIVELEEPSRLQLRFSAPGGADSVLRVASSAATANVALIRVHVEPQRFANRLRVVGESVSYEYTRRLADGTLLGEPSTGQKRVKTVNADGSYVVPSIDEPGKYEAETFDRDGNQTNWDWYSSNGDLDDGDGNFWTPSIALREFPLYVGKTWSTSWTDAFGSPGSARNQVLAYEQVTVPAGTFAALRTLSILEQEDRECWWSVDQQVDVKCIATFYEYAADGRGPVLWITTKEAVAIIR